MTRPLYGGILPLFMDEYDGNHDRDQGAGSTFPGIGQEILSIQRRRYVLYCLYTYTNPMFLPDIAHQVTDWEYDEPVEELLDERLHVYMSLYHDHIPALEAANLITYSQEEDVVELTERAESLSFDVEQLLHDDLFA